MSDNNEFDQKLGALVENWRSVSPPAREILQGKYCRLEPISESKHGAALFQNLCVENLGESWTYLPYGPFVTYQDFAAWLNRVNSEQDTLLYTILNNEGQAVGVAAYLRINPEHGVIEVGHLHYSKQLQKTPAATEAMYLMMSYALEVLGYRRYEWKCNSLNEGSKAAALRLGFRFEGIFRQSNVFKGRNRDTAWFSILDKEWPLLRKKFEQWLNPGNFAADGQQCLRLRDF